MIKIFEIIPRCAQIVGLVGRRFGCFVWHAARSQTTAARNSTRKEFRSISRRFAARSHIVHTSEHHTIQLVI